MGDFRASIKVEITLYDIEDSWETWINYNGTSGEVSGVDDRVIGFFRNVFARAWIRYKSDLADFHDSNDRREIEMRERAELERLKAKYPD